MGKDLWRQALNVVALLATMGINALANALPLNGQTTGEISDRFEVFFTPAGYVFTIWSVIYLGLLAFAIYQALPAARENPRLRRVGYLFVLSSVANIAWLFLWHYEVFPLTLPAMLAILVSLILIYLRLGIGVSRVSLAERLFVHLPFSIYLGWISVATIANATALLDFWGWDGFGIRPEIWTAIMLLAGFLIATAVSLTRGDIAYALVIMWAFVGIAVKHPSVAWVAYTAWVMTALVLTTLVFGLVLRIRRRTPAAA